MMGETPEEIILLDVRTEDEYDAEHIQMPGVLLIHIPLSELKSRLDELDRSKKIIVYSRNGADSVTACDVLVQHGFELVYNMLGGIEEWKTLNFPTTTLFTPTLTPTATPSITPTPSPTVVASTTASPTPASTPIPPGKRWGLPGFEVVFTIIGLLMVAYLISKGKGGDKNE